MVIIAVESTAAISQTKTIFSSTRAGLESLLGVVLRLDVMVPLLKLGCRSRKMVAIIDVRVRIRASAEIYAMSKMVVWSSFIL